MTKLTDLRYHLRQGAKNQVDWIKVSSIGAVVAVKHCNRHSDFAESASYGYCASRNLKNFGYKLVAITTFKGIPVMYDLVPVHKISCAFFINLTFCIIEDNKGMNKK